MSHSISPNLALSATAHLRSELGSRKGGFMKVHSMIFLLAVFVMVVPQAFAYEIYFCGDDKIEWEGTPRIRASAVGFPEGHIRSAALQAVVDRWNASPADFRFNLTWNEEH